MRRHVLELNIGFALLQIKGSFADSLDRESVTPERTKATFSLVFVFCRCLHLLESGQQYETMIKVNIGSTFGQIAKR